MSIEPFLTPSRSTRYLANSSQWIFSYPRATPLSTFFVDLRGLAFLHKIFLQFLSLSLSHCPSDNNCNHYLSTPENTAAAHILTTARSAANSPFAFQPANSTLDLNFFRLVAFAPTHISFAYGNQVHPGQSANATTNSASNASSTHPNGTASTVESYSYAFHIYWKGGPRINTAANVHGAGFSSPWIAPSDSPPHIVFEPSKHPLTPFINAQLESWINEPNLRFVLELVWNVHPVLVHASTFIEQQHGTLRSSDVLIIPHANAKLRIFFRHWSLDWRFLGNRFVCIEEAKRSSDQSLPLLNFVPFMQSALKRIIASSPSRSTTPFPINQTPNVANEVGFVSEHAMQEIQEGNVERFSQTPHSAHSNASAGFGQDFHGENEGVLLPEWAPQQEAEIRTVLAKERDASHFFVGNSFVVLHADLTLALLPMLQAYFGSLRFFMVVEREERAERQLNENGEFFLPYRRTHQDYEISLILRKPSYMLDVVFPSNIAQDEVELLSQLLHSKIVCSPYRMAHLRAFLAIFMLPLTHLGDIISLLRYSRDRTAIAMDLNFSLQETIPPIVVHTPTAPDTDWRITLALTFTNAELQQTIAMSVCYNYKSRFLSSQDPFSSEFFTRNGIISKPFGSLAGVIDSLVRFLQRGWNIEYGFYLTKHPQLISSSSSASHLTSTAITPLSTR